MAAIAIKGRDEKLQIIIQPGVNFALVLEELSEKLQTMQRLSQHQPWVAFFSIPSTYDEKQLFLLFQAVQQTSGIIGGFLEMDQQPSHQVWEADIRSGEHLVFDQPTIIVGNVHKDAFVKCYEDLFVMGKIAGTIQLFSKVACLYGMSFDGANIQFFDEIRPNVASSTPLKQYYCDSVGKEETLCLKS